MGAGHQVGIVEAADPAPPFGYGERVDPAPGTRIGAFIAALGRIREIENLRI